MAYFALHNQTDGQGDGRIVVQHWLVHGVHNELTDLASREYLLLDLGRGNGNG